jgi:hypothetical protein
MNGLEASRPSATTSSVGAVLPSFLTSSRWLGGLGLDHHDGDVVTDDAAGDDHVEGRALDVGEWLGKATHWPSISATRTPPIGPLNGRPEIWVDGAGGVDREHVVLVVGVERQHGDDDLDLVAQALDEGRAQRAVDQPAGEDRLGRGAALATEERAGDAPAAYIRSSTSTVSGKKSNWSFGVLPGGGRRQQHGLAVEVGGDRRRRPDGPGVRSRTGRCGCRTAVVDDGSRRIVISGPSMGPPFLFHQYPGASSLCPLKGLHVRVGHAKKRP